MLGTWRYVNYNYDEIELLISCVLIYSLLHCTQPTYIRNTRFPGGIPKNSEAAKENYFVCSGSPAENGVSKEQLHPFPRCAMHASYIKKKDELMTKLMKVGFCYSQPMHVSNHNEVSFGPSSSANLSLSSIKEWCDAPDIWRKINVDGEWSFESKLYGDLWVKSDPNGVLDAHQARRKLNKPRKWDMVEVEQLFST